MSRLAAFTISLAVEFEAWAGNEKGLEVAKSVGTDRLYVCVSVATDAEMLGKCSAGANIRNFRGVI